MVQQMLNLTMDTVIWSATYAGWWEPTVNISEVFELVNVTLVAWIQLFYEHSHIEIGKHHKSESLGRFDLRKALKEGEGTSHEIS